MEATEGGRYPMIMDASTCTVRMQKYLAGRLKLFDFHEFAADALLPRLLIAKQAGPIALHVNCSVRKSGSDAKLQQVLAACVEQIIEPAGVTCCGFAGDRGFVVPELNQHALRKIHDELPASCACGVFNQPHLRNRPDGRNRAHLSIDCLPARGMQSQGGRHELLEGEETA